MTAFVATHATDLGVLLVVVLAIVAAWSPLLCRTVVPRVEGRKPATDTAEPDPVAAEEAREEAMRASTAERKELEFRARLARGNRSALGEWLKRRENVPALKPVGIEDGRVVPLNNTREVGNG